MFNIQSIDRIDTIGISAILISYIIGSFYNDDKIWNRIYVGTINIVIIFVAWRFYSLISHDYIDNQCDTNTIIQSIILVAIINTALFISSLIIRWISNIGDHYTVSSKYNGNVIISDIVKNINELTKKVKLISEESSSSIQLIKKEIALKSSENHEFIDGFKMDQLEISKGIRNDIQELADRLTSTVNTVIKLTSKK